MIYLHEQLTQALLAEMASGFYRQGDRFLSNRKICKLWNVSDSTACRSLLWLQANNLIEARPQSGYFLKSGFRRTALYHIHKRRFDQLPSPSTWRTKRYGLARQGTAAPRYRIACVFSGKSRVEVTDRIPAYFDASETQCAQGFFTEAIRTGGNVQFYIHNEKSDGHEHVVSQLLKDAPDGIAVFRRGYFSNIEPIVRPLLKANIPVVTVFDDCEHLEVLSVTFNNVALGYEAANRFLSNGHKRLGVLIQTDPFRYFTDRADGCRRAIEESGVPGASVQEISVSAFQPIPRQLDSIFRNKETRPTALLATRVDLLLKLVPWLKRRNIEIPRDLSVIAIASPETTPPKFDMISIDFTRMGTLAMSNLRKLIDGEIHERAVLVETPYIECGTVKARRGKRQRSLRGGPRP